MVVQDDVMFLGAEENSFKSKDDGRDIKFYRVNLVSFSDNKPVSLLCSRDVYESTALVEPYSQARVVIEIAENSGRMKVRCTFLGTAVENA